jgi:hypothetical protein
MSEALDNPDTKEGDTVAKSPGKPFWGRFAGLAVLGGLLAIVAIAGGSTIYCQSLPGAVFWTLLASFWLPVAGLIHEPDVVLWPLAAYVVVVYVIARYTRLRPTLLNFTIAAVATYALGAAVDWGLGWTNGVCSLV